jgi:hypothetical protein
MPRIFENIEQSFLSALWDTLELADRADFCVGYDSHGAVLTNRHQPEPLTVGWRVAAR